MSAFEEFHHEERVTLIENLDRALSGMAKLSSATWACLWLSDIEKLRGFVTRAETCPEDILQQLENHDVEHLRKCEYFIVLFLIDENNMLDVITNFIRDVSSCSCLHRNLHHHSSSKTHSDRESHAAASTSSVVGHKPALRGCEECRKF